MNSDLVHALVDRIYAAADEPERWQDFLEELSDALGGPAIRLILQLPGFGPPARTYAVHLRSAPEFVLASQYSKAGLLFSGDERVYPAGFTPLDEVLDIEGIESSDFATEWLEPQGLLPLRGLVYWFAVQDRLPLAMIAIVERRGGRALGPSDRAFCNLLAPHLACAYRLHRRIGGEQHEREVLAEVMNRLPIGLVLLDRELRPVVTNRSAARILALDDGFTLGPDGLRAANARDDSVMQQIFSEFVTGSRSADDGETVMTVTRPSGKRAFPVLLGMLHDAAAGDVVDDAVVSVIFGDPESGQGITPEALRSGYDLTSAESELVGLLAEGYSLAEAARMRAVSLNTVRTQLKHVFAKTETNRQGELIRLVLAGSASFPRRDA